MRTRFNIELALYENELYIILFAQHREQDVCNIFSVLKIAVTAIRKATLFVKYGVVSGHKTFGLINIFSNKSEVKFKSRLHHLT